MELGDAVERALSSVGVDKSLVERWLGRNCGCRERQDRLNALSAWARRVISGRTTSAESYLHDIIRGDGSHDG
jgi:hypothetical protein